MVFPFGREPQGSTLPTTCKAILLPIASKHNILDDDMFAADEHERLRIAQLAPQS